VERFPLPATVKNSVGPLRDLNGVELFAVGDHHGTGKPFTLDDLKEIERNFYNLLESADPHHDPAGCLGHEEDQAHLKAILRDDAAYQAYVETMDGSDVYHRRTGQPAAGRLRNVKVNESTGKVTGDLKGIPPSIADMIDAGLLTRPSSRSTTRSRRTASVSGSPFGTSPCWGPSRPA
jgi:hypothetical protein